MKPKKTDICNCKHCQAKRKSPLMQEIIKMMNEKIKSDEKNKRIPANN